MRKMSPSTSSSSSVSLTKTPLRLPVSRTTSAGGVEHDLGVARREVAVGVEERAGAAADHVLALLQRVRAALGAVGADEDEPAVAATLVAGPAPRAAASGGGASDGAAGDWASRRVPHWPQKVNSAGTAWPQVGHSRAADAAAPSSSSGDGAMPSAGIGCRCASESWRSRSVPVVAASARCCRRASSTCLGGEGLVQTRLDAVVAAGCRRRAELVAATEAELVLVLVVPPARLASGHQVISTRSSCWPRKT